MHGIGVDAGATTQKSTVTIGVIAPIDGGLTSFGQGIRNSVQLAVDQANQRHAIPGWTIKLRALDDSSDAAKGNAAAATLAADPSVVAVVGPYNSGVAEQAAPMLAKRGLALVSLFKPCADRQDARKAEAEATAHAGLGTLGLPCEQQVIARETARVIRFRSETERPSLRYSAAPGRIARRTKRGYGTTERGTR